MQWFWLFRPIYLFGESFWCNRQKKAVYFVIETSSFPQKPFQLNTKPPISLKMNYSYPGGIVIECQEGFTIQNETFLLRSCIPIALKKGLYLSQIVLLIPLTFFSVFCFVVVYRQCRSMKQLSSIVTLLLTFGCIGTFSFFFSFLFFFFKILFCIYYTNETLNLMILYISVYYFTCSWL